MWRAVLKSKLINCQKIAHSQLDVPRRMQCLKSEEKMETE
jgi:hypothetical protein